MMITTIKIYNVNGDGGNSDVDNKEIIMVTTS